MNRKPATKQILILFTLLIVAFCSSCIAQTKKDFQESDSITLNVKIINMLPVGWGVKYSGAIEKIIAGNTMDFSDTIIFGIIASKDYENINTGDTCFITFKNTKEICKTSYLPAINGTVSKQNEIWSITKIEKGIGNKKSTFVGTAVMSEGKAMFIWDFADSEAYYLDGLQAWDSRYLNKKIRVEGVLVQFIDGKSVIKDWKIIENW
jgi:hypothetical protein